MATRSICTLLLALPLLCNAQASISIPYGPVGSAPPLPFLNGPQPPPPPYMVDNTLNQYGVAPDKGILLGPITEALNTSLRIDIGPGANDSATLSTRQSGGYWLEGAPHGKMPLAPSGYRFFRNVKDYGAVGDGSTDDTAAINRAITDGNRCGADCGSTSTLGALVYFPTGTYRITTPIIQYFYTQFVGDPNSRPTIKGDANFSGIALVDTDFYIPGGNGAEWYINQNNFFRQIRNINFDLRGMASENHQGDQTYSPTGIHWQVAQGTSIQNVDIQMDVSSEAGPATAIGIFTENGSGGFMSDITITGGHYGMRIGSQQFTVRNIQFTSCLTAINHIWNWGFTWQQIYVLSCYVALNCTEHGGPSSQGTGSIAVLDSHFNGVPYAITVSQQTPRPNVVLDNLLVENSQAIVLVDGGETILPGSADQVYVNSWAVGRQYRSADDEGSYQTGYVPEFPQKAQSLLDASGRFYVRSKPQYESVGSVIAATNHGVSNNMDGDQTDAINTLLSSNVGSVIFFPAGIYLIGGTIHVPPGSVIVGEGWSQFMATGSYFSDAGSPKALVQVGSPGDSGSVEISDMLFTVQGGTAGCILMEWNIHQGAQGSAAMWDSHFRVGGAAGSDLQLADCPTGQTSVNDDCIAGSMMLHVSQEASGYFENVWAWVADHDLDDPSNAKVTEGLDGVPQNVRNQVSIYNGRGILVESSGPTWLVGTSSEHSTLYQYQVSGATDVYMGHIQTETPYYQPNPLAPLPFDSAFSGDNFALDPTFDDCSDDFCKAAWALRVLNSTNVYVYSSGFYSFFQNNELGCSDTQQCQQRILETNYVQDMWLYNLFTRGVAEIASPRGAVPIFFNDSNQSGYTSEVAVWIPLSGAGSGDIGQPLNGSGSGDVYIDPIIWTEPDPKVVQCFPPCTFILPNLTLSTTTTISFPPYSTSLEVGWTTTDTVTESGSTTVETYFTSVIQSTVLTIPPVTTTEIPVWNVVVNDTSTTTIYATSSILPPPFIITDDPNPLNQTGVSHSSVTRTIQAPPFPYETSGTDPGFPLITFKTGPPKPTCTANCGHKCRIFCDHPCGICPPGISGSSILDGNFMPPNDPDRPDTSPDDECEISTFSSCRTVCVATPTSSCSSTCSPVVGCDTTGTEIATTYMLTPASVYTITDEHWTTATNGPALSDVADSIYSSFSSMGLYDSTAANPGQSPSTSGPGLTTVSTLSTPAPDPTVRTIYITSTVTATSTIQAVVSAGALSIVAQSANIYARGQARSVTDYLLDFFPPSTTVNPCSVGFYSVNGDASPKPSTWSAYPAAVTFKEALTSGPSAISSCSYTSQIPGAPSGFGALSCKGADSTFACAANPSPFSYGCDPDAVAGYNTVGKLLVGCDWSTTTSTVVTETSETVQTIVTTLRS